MQQHLEHLFGGFLDGCHNGLVEIAYTDAADHKLKHACLFGTDELEEAAQFACAQNSIAGQNVYVGAALRKPAVARDKRANDQDIFCLTSFYVDLDEGDAAAQAKQRYRNCPPTCAVITGRTPHTRAQLWWRQAVPEQDLAAAKQQNIALAAAMGGDRTVINPSRVMRLAGSLAWPAKPGRILERTELQIFNDGRPKAYPENQLSRVFPPATSAEKPAPGNQAGLTLNIGTTDALSVEMALQNARNGQAWHNNVLRLIAHWISRGWSDAEIIATAENLTLPGYQLDQTRREIKEMTLGARAKWAIPNPINRLDEFVTIPLNPIYLQDLNVSMLPRRRWVLSRSLLIGHLSLLIAPPGVGKTTLCITQAVAVGINENLTNQPVHESGDVWAYNNEDDLNEMKRRLAAVLLHHNIPFSKVRGKLVLSSGDDRPLLIAKADRKGSVIRQPDVNGCIEFIKRNKIKLFVVDPFVETHEVEENSNEQIKVVAQMFREIARQGECAVLLVHHTAKPPQGSSDGHAGNMNTARGASALTGIARSVQTLFSMSSKDAETFGIKDEDRHLYIRLDDAKANLSLVSPDAIWFKRVSVTISNGDEVGVLEPVDLTPIADEKPEADTEFSRTLIACLLAQCPEEKISLNTAATRLAWGTDNRFHKYQENDPRGYQKARRILREAILTACRLNITIYNDGFSHGFTADTSARPAQLIRFKDAIDPLSQPEFKEDIHV